MLLLTYWAFHTVAPGHWPDKPTKCCLVVIWHSSWEKWTLSLCHTTMRSFDFCAAKKLYIVYRLKGWITGIFLWWKPKWRHIEENIVLVSPLYALQNSLEWEVCLSLIRIRIRMYLLARGNLFHTWWWHKQKTSYTTNWNKSIKSTFYLLILSTMKVIQACQ